MQLTKKQLAMLFIAFTAVLGLMAQQQKPPTPAQSVKANFADLNKRLVEMAKDFPADKYDFKPKPEMRSFGEVLVHAASGNVYAAKAAKDAHAKWDELDPKKYAGKDAVVALFEKSSADAQAELDKLPDSAFAKSIEPWVGISEHSAEHYGQLVVYYRLNDIVPPASRKQ